MTRTKSLKDENSPHLTAVVAALSLIFIYLINIETFGNSGELFNLTKLVPSISAAVVISAVARILNGLVPAEIKATIVFWRIKNPLPGSRAFSKFIFSDARINPEYWSKLVPPETSPEQQNREWYKIYTSVRENIAVKDVHKHFLLCRDISSICILFAILTTSTAFYMRDSKTAATCLILYTFVSFMTAIAAQQYGKRLVTTALAMASVSAKFQK